MGTNFYAKVLPSKERKKELTNAIKKDDFSLIKKLTDEMYGDLKRNWDSDELVGGIVHLGKRSAGWKFLWNPNMYLIRHGHLETYTLHDGQKTTTWKSDPDTAKYLYPLTRKGIKAFIMRDDVEVYDEYGEKQDKEEFLNRSFYANTWHGKEAWDAATYEAEHPQSCNYRNHGEYIDLLRAEGFKFTSESCSDFYSDGLRFATSTEFS